MPDTATAMEYSKSIDRRLVAMPTPAMMNENSPICARLMPVFTEFERFGP